MTTDKFASKEFQEFSDGVAAQVKDGTPIEANVRRVQLGDYPFGYAPFTSPPADPAPRSSSPAPTEQSCTTS